MLLNALVHRTYMGATIQMRVFDDKLSIWNEGGLPFGLSLEDLKAEHNSRPRNPLIANACFFAGYIDTWGRGTLKIIDACLKAGLPEPVIREMNGGVQITVFLTEVAESGLVDNENRAPKGGQVGGVISSGNEEAIGGQVGGQVESLTERQHEILSIIQSNKKISRKQLSEILGINESAVQKHIDALKRKNIIERDSATTGQWIIKVQK